MSTNNQPSGKRHPEAAFTDDEVREIRAAREKVPQPSISALAAKYRVTRKTISYLLNGRTYKDVK